MFKTKTVTIQELYHETSIETQKKRYADAIEKYREYFGSEGKDIRIFSAPGRTEIGGNHTDHNRGKVIAASVDLDIIAIVEPIEVNKIALKSEGFPESGIWFDDLSVKEEEKNTADALIRGVLKGFINNGYKIGGFKAYTVSNVLKGSGLSSSAAFEIVLATILSCLYNNAKINPIKMAQIGQYAENVYFGKPSGLMDQTACSVGGFVLIDFKETNSPIVEKIETEFFNNGHTLCIVDTVDDHSDLTEEYASIPQEMIDISSFFDVKYLRRVAKKDIILNINALRDEFGDRAVLRSLHYFDENNRVDKLVYALRSNEFERFLRHIKDSGNSSYKYLQNVFSCADPRHQSVSIGLFFAESFLGSRGACRVHGGGFAGTIQAFVPDEMIKIFKVSIERILGAGTCHELNIREYGGVEVLISSLED